MFEVERGLEGEGEGEADGEGEVGRERGRVMGKKGLGVLPET
jgi:hypothetical protein